jgi:hypothetical protein
MKRWLIRPSWGPLRAPWSPEIEKRHPWKDDCRLWQAGIVLSRAIDKWGRDNRRISHYYGENVCSVVSWNPRIKVSTVHCGDGFDRRHLYDVGNAKIPPPIKDLIVIPSSENKASRSDNNVLSIVMDTSYLSTRPLSRSRASSSPVSLKTTFG